MLKDRTLSTSHDLTPLLANLSFLDEIWSQYQLDPGSVDVSWRALFESPGGGATGHGNGQANGQGANGTHGAAVNGQVQALGGNGHAPGVVLPGQAPAPAAPAVAAVVSNLAAGSVGPDATRLPRVWALVNAYRVRGHLEATLDPLGMHNRAPHVELDPRTYGFGEADMDARVGSGGLHGVEDVTLRDLVARLRHIYCGTVGLEFMHISAPDRKRWLAERHERANGRAVIDAETKRTMLERILRAEAFERFCHNKFVGTKRFSLEGSETAIALLDLVLEHGGRLGIEEAVVGMAHRGRLNVLTQTMGKRPREIFAEFEDINPELVMGAGDVKYHMGFSSDHTTRGGKKLHLSLAFNPSHLEAVDPVVVGRVRAKQKRKKDAAHAKVVAILIHGDAAFAGQGLVAEVLNISELHGFRTGGTVHVIINNQIGFTTSPHESRSTPYATDVAKMIQCPIFHVNGEDPEAVAHVVALAMDYRQEYQTDVVIDMFCYRKYGHNEGDEPSFTQPLLYRRIEQKEPISKLYADALIADGTLSRADVDAMQAKYAEFLEGELAAARKGSRPVPDALHGVWAGYVGGPDEAAPEVDTGVPAEVLAEVGVVSTTVPAGFTLHPKIARLFQQRVAMARGELPVDWGMAELLAYGTLAREGRVVRMSGQDSCRGTFSHRHAVVVDYETGEEFNPIRHDSMTRAGAAEFRIFDSALSEAAILGFEFGYSLDFPDGLVIWEAQFGDFVNGAQVIIDQFIVSSEDKWSRLSGITLFLPHGFEGQGPEHSSARFERFLEMCAEDNIQVCQPSNAAQQFHLLRRQVHRTWRKPLVVLTPKSLLRLPAAGSPIAALASGRFQRILPDDGTVPAGDVTRLFLCSGKVYYELVEERKRRADTRTGIARLEQLYPLRPSDFEALLSAHPKLTEVVWVQDEPKNMGAYPFIALRLPDMMAALGKKVSFRAATRPESGSPATGSHKAHQIEQKRLFAKAFD